MIIGRDILSELGIDLHFSTLTCTWEQRTIPMREGTATIEQTYLVDETGPVADSTNRIKKILDAKYEAADIPKIVESCSHLKHVEKEKLAKLLSKYENLFDGTLGQWKGPPVEIQLREGAKPYHARAYPIPKSQEAKIRNE